MHEWIRMCCFLIFLDSILTQSDVLTIIETMPVDNLSLQIISDSLKKERVGARIGRALALNAKDYALPYVREEENGLHHGSLIFSRDPVNPFVCYSLGRFSKIEDTSPFYNSLKKLYGGTVLDVVKHQGERIISFKIKADRSDITNVNSGYDLIFELFPNRPNCYIIAYPYGKIVSLYHEHTDIEKGIYLTRNAIYNYPLTRKPLPLERQDPEEARPYLPNATLRYLKQYVQKGHDLKDTLKARKESSSLYVYKKDILSFSFGLEGVKEVKVEDLYSCFVQDQKEVARLEKVKELLNLIHKAIKNNKKKEINLEQDLNTAKDRRKYLTYGQRIYQYQAEISKGDKVLERDGESIPLNPRLDAPHNANYYFKKYQKAKAALVILTDLIEKCKEDSLYLEKKEREIVDGTPRDIRELKSELLEEGYIKEKQGRNTVYKVSKKHSYDPHYLIAPEGKIGFGRNGLQNEELTFKQAHKEDTFLHVKDYPGAHVVILEGKGDEILRLAGELCLYLSHLSSGTIRVAKKKDVKKNPSHIGLVNILKYNTREVKFIREESLAIFKKALKKN